MFECVGSNLPMQQTLQLGLSQNDQDVNQIRLPYRELIGSLMYIMLGSRPDLSFSVTYFSQFQNSYNKEHWSHAKGILRYLKSTRNVGIKFVKRDNTDVVLRSYVDSDFANNVIDRKSITGFLIKINHNIVAWKTKKHNVVTLSRAESEMWRYPCV